MEPTGSSDRLVSPDQEDTALRQEMRKQQEILIIEPFATGHRMQLVRHLVDAIGRANLGKITVAVARSTLTHPAARALVQSHSAHFAFETLEMAERGPGRFLDRFGVIARQFYSSHAFRKLFKRLGGGDRFYFVFIPYLEYCLLGFEIFPRPFGGVAWGGITMRTRFHFRDAGISVPVRRSDLVRKYLFSRLLKDQSLTILASDEPYLAKLYADKKVVYVPDPAQPVDGTTRVEARAELGLKSDDVAILVYGSLDGRKSIEKLIAVATDPRTPENLVIVLAGVHSADVVEMLQQEGCRDLQRAGRIIDVDRYLTSEDEHRFFSAADIVWLVYRNHYASSGVQVLAGQAALPIVTGRSGIIARLTEEHGLGCSVDADDHDELVRAVTWMTNDSEARRRCGLAGAKVFRRHTPEAFAQPIVDAIKIAHERTRGQRLGACREP